MINYFLIINVTLVFMLLLSEVLKYKELILSRGLTIFSIFIYSLLVAFKGDSGSDTFLYLRAFDSYYDYSTLSDFGFSDLGFGFIYQVVNYFNLNFDYINYINAVLIFFSLNLLSKYKNNYIVVVFIAIVGLNIDFSTIRQSYAIHIFIIIYLVTKRQSLSVIVAFLFHKSSLLSYIVNLSHTKLSIKKALPFFSMFSVIFYFFYVFYLNRYIEVGSTFLFRNGFNFIVQIVLIVLILYLLGYENKILIVCALIMIIPIGYRVFSFFLIMESVKVTNIKFNRILLFNLTLILFLLKVFSFSNQSILNDSERSTILHYQSYFQGEIN